MNTNKLQDLYLKLRDEYLSDKPDEVRLVFLDGLILNEITILQIEEARRLTEIGRGLINDFADFAISELTEDDEDQGDGGFYEP